MDETMVVEERKKLNFTPVWKGSVEGWAVKYCAKNLWRVKPLHDFDDLYQESFHMFLVIADRYAEVCEPAHFMRLFQISLVNHFHWLANVRTERNEVSAALYNTDGESLDLFDVAGIYAPEQDRHDLEVMMMLDDAPEPIEKALRQIVERGRPAYQRTEGVRETTNQFLCRLSGLDPRERDVVGLVVGWLKGETCAQLSPAHVA